MSIMFIFIGLRLITGGYRFIICNAIFKQEGISYSILKDPSVARI